MSRISLKSAALLMAFAPLGGPALAQAHPAQGALNELARAASRSDPLTTSYSGFLIYLNRAGMHVTATVTRGKVQCTGGESGEPPISFAGAGRIDLELGLSDEDQPANGADYYRITLHCPVNNDGRALRDLATSYKRRGGAVTLRAGRMQGPEELKGDEEGFHWELSRVRQPQPPATPP